MDIIGLIEENEIALWNEGDIIGTMIPIDQRFSEGLANSLIGRYSVCESIARSAVDADGFLYVYGKEQTVLCYGKEDSDTPKLYIGVGVDARTAKSAIFDKDNRKVEFVRDAYAKKSWDDSDIIYRSVPVILTYDPAVDFNINAFPRDFTWEMPNYPAKEVERYNLLYSEGGDFHLANCAVFQSVDNDFVIPLETAQGRINPQTGIYVAQARPCARNEQRAQFIIFGEFDTDFGEFFSGYETDESPFFDIEAVVAEMKKKVVAQHRYEINKVLGRGEAVDIETVLKYFKRHRFVATPAHSRAIGNCAVGTWNWVNSHLHLKNLDQEPGTVSWDNFPIPLNEEFRIPFKQLESWIWENSSFQRVVFARYKEENPGKAELSAELIAKIMFDSAEERKNILTPSEIKKVEEYFFSAA